MSGALAVALPLTAEEFSLLLEPFTPLPSTCAVGVSGGPDSLALALCLKRYLGDRLQAFIVDHDLRASSASEAAATDRILKDLGITSQILTWTHEPIRTRLHEQARDARYRLLEQACHQNGITALFIAHHQEDQAETILMRIAKGSGVEGLAGMSPRARRGGIELLRPLLRISKSRLIATCVHAGISFIDDPSNGSEKFARGRLRKIMPLLKDEGLTVEGLLTLGERAHQAAEAISFFAREFLHHHAVFGLGGTVCVSRAALRRLPRAVCLKALQNSLRFIAVADHPPEHTGLSTLADQIIGHETLPPRSFYGCLVSVGQDRLGIIREPSAAKEDLVLRPGECVLWDKRWLVSSTPSLEGHSYRVRALGVQSHASLDLFAPGLRHKIPQGRVRASLPGVFVDSALVAIPSFLEDAPFRMVHQKQSFP